MQNRAIKGLGSDCSVIGFGAWGVGGETPGGTSYGPIEDEVAIASIAAGIKEGVNFFDTSPAYGYGISETRLGKALDSVRNKVILATKGGLYTYEEGSNFNPDRLLRGLDSSLTRLQTNYIDLFQLHNPPTTVFDDIPKLRQCLDDIVSSGKARAIGVSVKAPGDAIPLLEQYPFQAVQANFNMLDMRALNTGLLDLCFQKDVAVLSRTPLCFGFLTLQVSEHTQFGTTDHRAHWPKEQLALWAGGAQRAHEIAASFDTAKSSATSRAIRFCLLHPAVKTVLTGPMNPAECIENAHAGNQPSLAPECLKAIQSLNKDCSFVIKRER